ncbi:hypothetical protein J4573_02510 [Actinomadura barringtoniae]|uniref:Uncharacterized protein n=1 Tax=Actinomadura barringtoniae TaxID=1427535 RepID=A0A939P6P7_9ACTN|nr:hypothetical protein [Actinomadura barringtoniae]MBO2445952.1 hypothetical protein [Actinomadura barringtoniae]
MAQQHGIIVLIDVANALESRTLDGNAYWFDNMKFLGSAGEGTQQLVTIVPGTYYMDGSQATEQVLNWLPAALGAIPPTVPVNYHAERAQQTDRQALEQLAALTEATGIGAGTGVERIQGEVGRRARRPRGSRSLTTGKVLDVTGQVAGTDPTAAYNYPKPVITGITGQAVDEKIMYPAQYGSPDMVYDGWYWAATVDTSRPGVYPYRMDVQLHELVERDGELVWESVNLACDSALKITAEPKVNGFTHAGLGALPVPATPPTA